MSWRPLTFGLVILAAGAALGSMTNPNPRDQVPHYSIAYTENGMPFTIIGRVVDVNHNPAGDVILVVEGDGGERWIIPPGSDAVFTRIDP